MNKPQKVLVVHNFYQQAGGEDVVFRNEVDLLRQHGHEVIEFTAHNDEVNMMGKAALAVNTIWSRSSKQKLASLIAQTKPDVAHFHNTFMVISPAAYYACRELGVPIVQTLHNYRLSCVNATFFRDQHVCEDCLGKLFALPGVIHGCYRESKVISGVVAGMLTAHRLRGTWTRVIDQYIALTEFSRKKLVQMGLPAEKVVVKTNFLTDDPGQGTHEGDYAVFVGRLTEEKGVRLMLEAWRNLPDIPLKVVGDGPLMDELQSMITQHSLKQVELVGRKPRNETLQLIKDARAMIFPSQWYEGMPMTIIEAFACGTPVIATRMGAMETVVQHERTGLHFQAGNANDLSDQVKRLWTQSDWSQALGDAGRQTFVQHYTADENYDQLLRIYKAAINRSPVSDAYVSSTP